MISFLETIAFAFLAALIRSNVSNAQIMLVLFCVFAYVIVFRSNYEDDPQIKVRQD